MKISRRYWTTGILVLFASLFYNIVPPVLCADEWVSRLVDGFSLFLIVVSGAAFGAAVTQSWSKRDNEVSS